MFHNSQAVLALSKEPNETVFQKTLGLNDFYFGDADFDFPMGNIQMVGKSQRRDVPRREADADEARAALDARQGRRARGRLLALDRGPAACRTTGSPLDDDGNVAPRLHADQRRADGAALHELKKLLNHLGMHQHHLVPRDAYMKNDIPVAGCAHQAGTCRFGTDPATSVLDADCKAHELDNLYVVDTSFFPSIGAVNPALTAMANALRVGDRSSNASAPRRREREPAHVS